MKKSLILFLVFAIFGFATTSSINASYNYSPYGEVIEQAESMSIKTVIDNSSLTKDNPNGLKFGNIKDIVVYENKIYVCDQTYSKIWVIDETNKIIDSYPKVLESNASEEEKAAYTLKSPEGIYVKNGVLYVCDTENERVVLYDLLTKEFITKILSPDVPVFTVGDENTPPKKFKPIKISVDRTGRMFVISRDVYEGMIDFDPSGTFNRFFGTNKVKMSFLDTILYNFASEEQKKKMVKKLQTSFLNLELDEYGNTYALANPNETTEIVKKFNNKGKNILEQKGYIPVIGDNTTARPEDTSLGSGLSKFVDIALSPDGTRYSAIDDVRGKIFTYDREGNLLYICGQNGSQSTTFKKATSIAYMGNNIIASDEDKKSILIFEPTKFGNLINEATHYYLNYEYDLAKEVWENVLKYNSNYYLAYSGIGKAQLREGNYRDALGNLKLGRDYYNYSQAYDLYRNDKLEKILPIVIVVVILGFGFLMVKNIKNSVKRDKEDN